jgi:hypothetical protein
MAELNPSVGSPTHVLHYAGQAIPLLSDHARLVQQGTRAATNGTVNRVDLRVTKTENGDSVQLQFLVGPSIPMLLEGPALPPPQ